ncbi:hypothetical protein T492DRAFT_843700 [Pavlovales sp. CCMP2436]|nr:hypothetical protein T492DRAFT_843700 [Pavlovales sp. CCMP2436]
MAPLLTADERAALLYELVATLAPDAQARAATLDSWTPGGQGARERGLTEGNLSGLLHLDTPATTRPGLPTVEHAAPRRPMAPLLLPLLAHAMAATLAGNEALVRVLSQVGAEVSTTI